MRKDPDLSAGALILAVLVAVTVGATAAAEAEPEAGPETTTEAAATDGRAADAEAADTGEPGADGFQFPPEVEALLNQASDPDAYAEMERCIFTRDIRDTDILDDRHVVFELSGKRLYLVQFQYTCHGLRRGGSMAYETRNGRLCRLDQIRAFEPGLAIPNPPCTLPGFMPVEKEQVALLSESLKAQRKAQLDAYKAEKKIKKQQKQEKQDSEAAEPVSG